MKKLVFILSLLCVAVLADNYAVVETATGHVTNIIVWDGQAPIATPDGFTLRPAAAGDAIYQPPTPPAPSPAEILAASAAQLLADDSNLREDVQRFQASVAELAAAGVSIPDPLTFRGLADAIEAHWETDKATAASEGLKLRNCWDDIVYHCGTLRQADELFPYLVSATNQNQ